MTLQVYTRYTILYAAFACLTLGSCKIDSNSDKANISLQVPPHSNSLDTNLNGLHPIINEFNKQVENTVALANLTKVQISFEEKKYEETYAALMASIDSLIPNEMHMLGYLHLHGYGVKKDYVQAMEWLAKGANKGSKEARNLLGFMYEKGLGVLVNYTTAFQHYRSAALAGSPLAMNNLGFLYEHGLGIDQDVHKAIKCYQSAANNGNALAMNNLGWSYITGRGVSFSFEKGIELLKKSAEKNEILAARNLEYIYKEGFKVEKNISLAGEWARKADSLDAYYKSLQKI